MLELGIYSTTPTRPATGVFSPGVPPAFHANYLATMAWLRQLEALCATRGSVERLRSSAAYTSLMRRWNTSVYFSLLFQEIAGERLLSTGWGVRTVLAEVSEGKAKPPWQMNEASKYDWWVLSADVG